jgi:tryptophanyl-tRNA synthetase
VKEHAEMALLLSMITPLAWLERNPAYKDLIQELKGHELHTHGFLGYPVLQASDILLYKADRVPVGEDQLPHLEITREIARRFNHLYGTKIFPEPQAVLSAVAKLPGLDGRKMSKSYDNCIYLSDSEQTIRGKVCEMVTDPARKRRTDKGHPEVCPVFSYQKIFNPEAVPEIERECRSAGIGCVDCKRLLADKIVETLKPIMEKRMQLAKSKKHVEDVIAEGARRARSIAGATVEEAKAAIGL